MNVENWKFFKESACSYIKDVYTKPGSCKFIGVEGMHVSSGTQISSFVQGRLRFGSNL